MKMQEKFAKTDIICYMQIAKW